MRRRFRTTSTAVRSSASPGGCIHSRSTTRLLRPSPPPRPSLFAAHSRRCPLFPSRRPRDPPGDRASCSRVVEADVELVPLYGALDAAEQDAALRESAVGAPAGRRRHQHRGNVGHRSGRDGGRRFRASQSRAIRCRARHRQPRRRSASRRIRQTSAPAAPGRLAPGVVTRLWDARDRLRPHREAEIHRVDLAGRSARSDGVGRRSAERSTGSMRLAKKRSRSLQAARAAGRDRVGQTDRSRPRHAAAAHPPETRQNAHRGRWSDDDRACVRDAVRASVLRDRERPRRPRICCRRWTSGTTCRPTFTGWRGRSSNWWPTANSTRLSTTTPGLDCLTPTFAVRSWLDILTVSLNDATEDRGE